MQFSKNTSTGTSKSLRIKIILVFNNFPVILLNKIDFPSPNKEIEKIIPNEKLKIIK